MFILLLAFTWGSQKGGHRNIKTLEFLVINSSIKPAQ